MSRAENTADLAEIRTSDFVLRYWLPWILSGGVAFVLLYQLGAPALFEPDEGRNAEKAREILVLNEWITPHENFYPVLDKPMFFYWLIAVSYKLFGVSEWSARLPSLLSAGGCVLLIYLFSRLYWGQWVALWSALVLVTSVEFFILARVVIFDMALTFFETIAFLAFFEAARTENRHRRLAVCLGMYLALGAGTLIKGLVGVVIPGMVFFLFILLRRDWHILRRMYLLPGAAIFFAVVLPWYLQADARNPGYLDYYLWAEHFGRYATASFDRSEPWYYFLIVTLVGFLPWTILLPWMIEKLRSGTWDDKTLYLVLWVVVPLLFFSASNSKLPHYILPIFPALSILAGATLITLYQKCASKLRLVLVLVWIIQSLNALYLLLGSFYPSLLPRHIRDSFSDTPHLLWLYPIASLLILGYLVRKRMNLHGPRERSIYLTQVFGLCLVLVFVVELMASVASDRSAKSIALKISAHGRGDQQVVLFDTYLSGLPFYLHANRPVWLVTHENKKRTFLGNYYALGNREEPVTPWGRAIYNFDEFRTQWESGRQPLLVVVKERKVAQLADTVGEAPTAVAKIDEYVLITKR